MSSNEQLYLEKIMNDPILNYLLDRIKQIELGIKELNNVMDLIR